MSITAGVPVWAAGAVPLRGRGAKREVLLVHRPAYDDWTLPKGKARSHELSPATAVREVNEETSTRIRLGAALTPTRYPLAQAMKIVSWWVGTTVETRPHKPNSEVDRAVWMNPQAALGMLTYADERGVLAEALEFPDTTPLIILRHAKALGRGSWKKPDHERPLGGRGCEQLSYVGQILNAFGVSHLISSTATRCVQTLTPYSKQLKADIQTTSTLSEEQATAGEVGAYVARLARAVGAAGIPTVVCGHLPVIPAMLAPLGIPERVMATASCVVAHLGADGVVVASEWHDTLRVKA